MTKALTVVNQRRAAAGRDVIAGDSITNNFFQGGVIAQLTAKLHLEIEKKQEIEYTVQSFACWQPKAVADGIAGLEAKLTHAKRELEIQDALVYKEEFDKLLLEWSLFGSAQEIFAIYLGKIEHEFKYSILPKIPDLDAISFNDLVTSKIADPIVFSDGSTLISITHRTVMGMFYWLADRCYVRWHA